MKKILLIALLGVGYAESITCAQPPAEDKDDKKPAKLTKLGMSAQALEVAKNAFNQAKRTADFVRQQVADNLPPAIDGATVLAKKVRNTIAIAPKKIRDNLPSKSSAKKAAIALTVLTLFAKRDSIKHACIHAGNVASDAFVAGSNRLLQFLMRPKTWFYLYILRLLYTFKIKKFASERLYFQEHMDSGVGETLQKFIDQSSLFSADQRVEMLTQAFTGFKSSAKAAAKEIEDILKTINQRKDLKSFDVKGLVEVPLNNVIIELNTVETSFVHFNLDRVIQGIEKVIGQLCGWRDDIRRTTNPNDNHFNVEEIDALKRVIIDLNLAKSEKLLFDLNRVKEQVAGDIKTLKFWHVSVGASSWANIKYLLGLGVKPFGAPQDIGWGWYNLWDLRYGSTLYKNKLLQLEALAPIIQRLLNAKPSSGPSKHDINVHPLQLAVNLTGQQLAAPAAPAAP